MSILKNEIPILEFDTDPTAVLMPRHENLDLKLPSKAVFPFLGDYVERFAASNNCRQVGEFISATKVYPVYITRYQGQEICLCQAPVGAAPAAQLMDWLMAYGVRQIISTGSCGTLTEIPENHFLIPRKALRDEGTSYHYAPPSRYMEVNPTARAAIQKVMARRGLPYKECVTWSTDGFYRETREKTDYRRAEGCSTVEMECAALAACAQLRGAVWGQILFTADTLADADAYDERNWGRSCYDTAFRLCLDALLELSQQD